MDIRLVEEELLPGEKITWSAKANPRYHASLQYNTSIFAVSWIILVVLWLGFSWRITGRFDGHAGFFPPIGILFLVFGTGMVLSPVYAYVKAQKTEFVGTNRRRFEIRFGGIVDVKDYRQLAAEKEVKSAPRNRRAPSPKGPSFGGI